MQAGNGSRTLILLTNVFPFHDWEPFLETEMAYLTDFSAIEVFSLSVTAEHARTRRPIANPLVRVHRIRRRPHWVYALNAPLVMLHSAFWSESWTLARTGALTPARLVELIAFLSRTVIEARDIKRTLAAEGVQGRAVFYAYRFYYQPYLAHLVARSLGSDTVVARAHGADLYEERSPTGYLPLRRWSLEHVKRLWLVSEHGRRYLAERHPDRTEVLAVSYLGSENEFGVAARSSARHPLRVVTCSAMVPVKRLDRMVRALGLVEPGSVEWVHYGDGPLRAELSALADEVLSGRIDYSFAGALDHDDLMHELWRQGFHLFVNVSESEGLPVSIMEACSFGIPVVATDVGGSSEIVGSDNGMLIAADASPEVIAEAVRSFQALEDQVYLSYVTAARQTWERKFDATRNYARFARELAAL